MTAASHSASTSGNLAGRKKLFLGLLLAAATLLLYLPSVHFEFLKDWDDDQYVTANPMVSSGLSATNVAAAFKTTTPYYWQPLSLISHMAAVEIFGLNAGGHHLLNVLLHAANALLLFALLSAGTGALWRSFLVSALFALHPVNVETVASVAERNNLLSAFFMLLAVAVYGWYVRNPSGKRYAALVGAFILSVMCKPLSVILLPILLLLDFWPLARYREAPILLRWGRLLWEKLPLILLCAVVTVGTVLTEDRSHAVMSFSQLPLAPRLENVVVSYVAYLRTLLVPVNLSPFYPHPAFFQSASISATAVAAAGLLLAAITAGACYWHRFRYALMGWLFFLITLLPVIGIFQTGSFSRADHFLYVPCIGVWIALVWSLTELLSAARVPSAVSVGAALCLVGAYAAGTAAYLPHWHDTVRLFSRAVAVTNPPNYWLEDLYGKMLENHGRKDDALERYRRSCELEPKHAECHYNMARLLFEKNEYRQAIAECDTLGRLAYRQQPGMVIACWNKSAAVVMSLGAPDAAERYANASLSLNPNDATARQLREEALRRKQHGGQ